MKIHFLLIFLSNLLFWACTRVDRASDYDFPKPVDTTDKPIEEQVKKEYAINGVYFDNRFEGARLNDARKENDSTYVVTILPENEPINRSPWYAFQVRSDEPKDIFIQLNYGNYKHRYHPKISVDGESWQPVDTVGFVYNTDSTALSFRVAVDSAKLWISAQELFTSAHLKEWTDGLGQSSLVNVSVAGQSRKGRDLLVLDIYEGSRDGKKLIVIFSRQHPPEVTGFFAMQSFVEALVNEGGQFGFFDDYRILVYPMLNPDGVDMGHWRHNTGGVDLNRDWAYYNQAEVRQIADHTVAESNAYSNKVVLGFDFHSTYKDVYYTQTKAELPTPTTEWFRDQWFEALESSIPGYKVNEKPAGLGSPVTKGWFYTQFGAEAMTYEIGDKTPRDSIQIFGKVAGVEMMRVLLNNQNRL